MIKKEPHQIIELTEKAFEFIKNDGSVPEEIQRRIKDKWDEICSRIGKTSLPWAPTVGIGDDGSVLFSWNDRENNHYLECEFDLDATSYFYRGEDDETWYADTMDDSQVELDKFYGRLKHFVIEFETGTIAPYVSDELNEI